MTMENQNENLTPDELIEKLKEKLAIDRDAYSKIVEETEVKTEDEILVEENTNEIDEMYSADDEIFEENEVEGEISEFEEIDGVIDDSDKIEAEQLDEYDLVEEDVLLEESNTFNDLQSITETPSYPIESEDIADEAVDSKIEQILKEIEADDDISDDENTVVFDKVIEDDQTGVFDAVKEDDEAVDSVSFENDQRRPKVYRFRLSSRDNEETKLHDAITDVDVEDEMAKTKLNDVPELKKPDLVVMQTFGATVEHVRSLYGDDIADEYEKMIANSDFTEREAVEYEYTTTAQKNEIFHEFKSKMQHARARIAASALVCLFMLLLENLSLIGINLGGIFNSEVYPISYIMIDLQLLLICGVLALPILKNGISEILMLEPTSRSVSSAMFVVAVLFDIISCFVGGPVILYNFTAGLALLFSMVCEVVSLKRDYMSFRVVSSDKVKNAAVVGVGTSKNEEVSVYEQLEDDEEVKIINLQRGKFIKSFFARTKQIDSSSQDKIILPLALAAMVVVFVISMATGKGASAAVKVANMSFSAFLPFAVYFSLCYPLNKASVSVYENGAAIIGNAALEEYSGSSIICFEDRDVFPSYCVKLKSVKVYGNASIDKVLYNTSSVFSKVGGPLCDVFSLSTVESGTSSDVELISADEDGIEALVDGKKILVGLPSFMLKYGINVRKDEQDTDDYARLYVAENDLLSAKFYIKYNLDVDFENVISRMTSCGICAVLKTYDPNINDKMLSTFIDTTKYPIKVIKCKLGDDFGEIHDDIDSGIISTNGAKSTVDATVTCERLYNIRMSANNVKVVSMIIGMILAAFMAVFGVTPFASLIVAVYQLLWMIPAIVSGKLYL